MKAEETEYETMETEENEVSKENTFDESEKPQEFEKKTNEVAAEDNPMEYEKLTELNLVIQKKSYETIDNLAP